MGIHQGGKEGVRGLWFGYHSNGINGHEGFKLAPDDSGGLTVFQSLISRFLPHYSVSFTPLLFLPHPVAAIYP